MPELPDVEILKRYFDRHCRGLKISAVQVLEKRILRDTTPGNIRTLLEGSIFKDSRRYGKHLFVEIGEGAKEKGQDRPGYVDIHFGMDGGLAFLKKEQPVPEYARIIFRFNGTSLAYISRRMLGGIRSIKSPESLIELRHLGPDALSPAFSRSYFSQQIARKKTSIKSALMDQQVVAGIGNVYSDEILYQAGILPDTPAGLLDEEQQKKVYGKIADVLKTAISYDADGRRFPRHFLLRHRQKNGDCPCGGKVNTSKVAGRTSYFCPACQK